MKHNLSIALCLGVFFAGPQRAESSETKKVFRAGACAMDITPPRFPISLNGGMSDRQATEAADRLHARCLVLDDGQTRVAIAVCDSCMIPRDLHDAAKLLASEKTGIPVARILTAATHTHSAPTLSGVFQSEPDEEYRQFFVERLAEGIAKANENLEPARVGWGVGRDPGQVFNRRWFMQAGTVNADPFGRETDQVRMNPGIGNKDNREPSGPVDPEIGILSVQAADGRPIALLANYSLHYVGGVPGEMASADYFGEYARRLTAALGATQADPPFVGIMSNGTSGNINNVDFSLTSQDRREPFEQIRVVAASVVDATMRAFHKIEHRDWAEIDMAETTLELGVRLPSEQDLADARTMLAEAGDGPYRERRHIYARETVLLSEYPRTVEAKLQAIRIGQLGIVSSPCETFVETGLAVKEHSPLSPTFTIELANGYNGYLPTPRHHELGGYETWRARSSYLAADAEPKIRETQLSLLEDVADDDSRLHLSVVDWKQVEERVQSHRGQVVAVSIWTTTCLACLKDFPEFAALQKKIGRADLACIAVNCDYDGIQGKPPAYYRSDVTGFLNGHDGRAVENVMLNVAFIDFLEQLELSSTPAVLVYGRDGSLVRRFDNDNATREADEYTMQQVETFVRDLVSRETKSN